MSTKRISSGYGLHVVLGTRTRPARATLTCPCGHHQRAVGTDRVAELVRDAGTAHRASCPLRMEAGAA